MGFNCPVQAIVKAYGRGERTVTVARPRGQTVSMRASGHRRARTTRLDPYASRRDPGESPQYGRLDGVGGDGFNTSLARWCGELYP